MLKIKKERINDLEKYGFRYNTQSGRWYAMNVKQSCYIMKDYRKYKLGEIYCKSLAKSHLDLIYDLVNDGLVEKVE